MNAMTDQQLEEAERMLNAAIHELVFAVQHMGQDDYDDAATCLAQAQQNIAIVSDTMAAASGR